MFGKRKPPGSGGPTQGGPAHGGPSHGDGEPHLPAEGEGRGPTSTPQTRVRPSYEVARRSFEAAAAIRRPGAQGEGRAGAGAQPGSQGESDAGGSGRKLVVGHGIRLAGEIKKCETLVVEGHIEADLNDCSSLEINQSGEFLGSAVVDAAEISGRFDGSLTVRGRLLLRASGELRGTIRYADLEIERGGRIAGDVDLLSQAGESVPRQTAQADASTAEQSENDAETGLEIPEGEPQQAAARSRSGKPGALV
ncbi:MAG: polymer-forming cytoskeletal protein [Kiloniellales bacterium]